MLVERDVDCGLAYQRVRRDLLARLGELSPAGLGTMVPATPDWSVHDVIAHVVGITHDLNHGEFGRDDPDEWTANQVRTRQAATLAELAAEWDAEAPTFEEGLRLLGYEIGSHYVGDLLHHIADIHHALGLGAIDDDEALTMSLDFYLFSGHESLRDAGVGTLRISVSDTGAEWVLGEGNEVARLAAQRFELFRVFGGRRSERQIRSLSWTGDVDVMVPLLSRYPLPTEDLMEASP